MVLSVPTSGGKTLLAQMLAVAHLARSDNSVCYVAPTRSLGREVRRAMASRVRILQREAGPDQPDYPIMFDLFSDLDDGPPPDVEVMTPERLAHLLRHETPAVLNRFGMFIFDEAQLIKERGRGFNLESTIALLHYATRNSEHQIILISAALGNAGAIAQWIGPDGNVLLHQSEWRGPRRLHAAFCTEPDWSSTRAEVTRGRKYPFRLVTDLGGLVRLRLSDRRMAELRTQGPTGWQLVRRSQIRDLHQRGLSRDTQRSTPHYRIASQMIELLGHAGSVLVVAGTRSGAQLLARGLAAELAEHPGSAPLVDFVRLQLGDEHPLVAVLRHGVGFHHAGLPIEVLEALEDAIRADTLPYLACTSTLTDGVNLPVRTVVIYDQTYEGQPDDVRIRGARMVNAMGRAGRAGKETEGWIVLVRAAAPTEADFRDLDPSAAELEVTSSLITEEALQIIAELEQAVRENEDAVFQPGSSAATDFISFVWFVLAVEEGKGANPETVDISKIVDSTLAARQSSQMRVACLPIAEAVRRAYVRSGLDQRQRWPRTGTSIGSASIIDRMARGIANAIISREEGGTLGDITDPLRALGSLATTIDQLLELPENSRMWRFRTSPQGGGIDVNPIVLLRGWLEGTSLSDLADQHLVNVRDPAYRIEQMVDAVTGHFEHYLAWTVGALVELVNARLSNADAEARLCPELGGYIRYGVRDPHALILMTSGIRSRRLAHRIVRDAPADLDSSREALRSWLARLSLTEWRARYDASAAEVLDLLDFTRVRGRSLLKTLLETGTARVTLPIALDDLPPRDGPLVLEPAREGPHPAPLAVYSGDQLLATIASQDHADLSAILDTGLDLVLDIHEEQDVRTLIVALPFGEATE